jgi:hypothetical protein
MKMQPYPSLQNNKHTIFKLCIFGHQKHIENTFMYFQIKAYNFKFFQ